MRIVSFKYREDYKIEVTFEDGTTTIKDMEPLFNKKIFEPLKDKDFFHSAKLENDTVTWPNGADFCPDTFYEKVKGIKHGHAWRPFIP